MLTCLLLGLLIALLLFCWLSSWLTKLLSLKDQRYPVQLHLVLGIQVRVVGSRRGDGPHYLLSLHGADVRVRASARGRRMQPRYGRQLPHDVRLLLLSLLVAAHARHSLTLHRRRTNSFGGLPTHSQS